MALHDLPPEKEQDGFLRNAAAPSMSRSGIGKPRQGFLNQFLQALGIGAISFQEGPLWRKFRRHWFLLAVGMLVAIFLFRNVLDVQVGLRKNLPGGPNENHYTEQPDKPVVPVQGSLFPLPGGSDSQSGVQSQLDKLSQEQKTQFLRRFAKVAQKESEKYGIPASVILGSALIHSLAGSTGVAEKANNIFAISCALNPIQEGVTGQVEVGGNCFTAYENAWTSFRAHSLLLKQGAFAGIAKRAGKSPSKWGRELEKAGYSAVPDFAETLAKIIEANQLNQFD